ncbi:piggyBac transposable element-derived protein 2-like [Vanessa cardui]|uniref:piggyBac transposable element-derived protein 2-like n=1 Tax=Vanessa cardui TaxID=171605 RepID=UPI001F133955|nr:piggyBac transposable element-derived protein 2-like [Vanessa cardui]
MSSRHLNVSDYYNGLEEAVIAVLEDSDSEADYEFAIIPPEPSVVTDEEEGADEQLTASLPRDVPGNIEVFRSNKDKIPCGDPDSSDDEPLAEKSKRSRRQPDQPVWRTCSPIYSYRTQERTDVIDRQKLVKEKFQDLTPVQIFEKIFDEEVISLIITNTILYANQNNRHTFQLDAVDLKKFLGILILSGYHKLPREDLYWSYDEDVGVEMV